MKVILIGGYPGVGKSFIVRKLIEKVEQASSKVLADGNHWEVYNGKYPALASHGVLGISYIRNGNLIIMGSYPLGEKFPGSDRLGMAVQPKFEELLLKLKETDLVVLSEGDRLFNGSIIRFLYEQKIDHHVIIIRANQELIEQRRNERSVQDSKWRKGRQTKVDNIAKQIKHVAFENNTEADAELITIYLFNLIGDKLPND